MMMLEIAQAVTHLLFAAGNGLRPEALLTPRDTHLARNQLEIGTDHQLRAERTGAQLGSSQIEIISFFEEMVGELVALHHSDSIGLAIPGDEICSGDLGFFAPICRVCGYHERFVVRPDDGAIALVEPLRSRADFSGRRAAAFDA